VKPQYEPKNMQQRLGYLVEECGEVLAAAGKTIRWGLDGFNPEPGASRETNAEWLLREIQDLKGAISRIETYLREHVGLEADAWRREALDEAERVRKGTR